MSKKKPTVESLEQKVDELEWKIFELKINLAKVNRQNHLMWELFKTMKTEVNYE